MAEKACLGSKVAGENNCTPVVATGTSKKRHKPNQTERAVQYVRTLTAEAVEVDSVLQTDLTDMNDLFPYYETPVNFRCRSVDELQKVQSEFKARQRFQQKTRDLVLQSQGYKNKLQIGVRVIFDDEALAIGCKILSQLIDETAKALQSISDAIARAERLSEEQDSSQRLPVELLQITHVRTSSLLADGGYAHLNIQPSYTSYFRSVLQMPESTPGILATSNDALGQFLVDQFSKPVVLQPESSFKGHRRSLAISYTFQTDKRDQSELQ